MAKVKRLSNIHKETEIPINISDFPPFYLLVCFVSPFVCLAAHPGKDHSFGCPDGAKHLAFTEPRHSGHKRGNKVKIRLSRNPQEFVTDVSRQDFSPDVLGTLHLKSVFP